MRLVKAAAKFMINTVFCWLTYWMFKVLLKKKKKWNWAMWNQGHYWGSLYQFTISEYKVCTNIPVVNLLMPNDHYSGRTTPLTSKRCILYIYSTNTGTEYFKHGTYSPFLSLQNAVCFIILTYLIPVLFIFYIQGVLKFKKIIPAPKG